MKKIALIIVLFLMVFPAMASHISGGELFYEYIGPGSAPNSDRYKITLRLFKECTSIGADLNLEAVNLGIYSTPTLNLVTTLNLLKQWGSVLPTIKNTKGVVPCLINEPSICYQVGLFSNTIDLIRTTDGYTLSWIRYSRQEILNINDDPYPGSATGATFITQIPGTSQLPTGQNSSPKFVTKDTTIVCAGKKFLLDFSATDIIDGDSLSYSFCPAFNGGDINNVNPPPPAHLTLNPMPYLDPYFGSAPLGPSVTIDSKTGLISGIAPPVPGKYLVNVCVTEWRNGIQLSVCRKDFILTVGDCDFAAAQLNPKYLTCDGFGLKFENQSTSSGINSYFWDFGVTKILDDTSTLSRPFFNYPDTGIFIIKLIINKGDQCSDSTTAIVGIYPGFFPGFINLGSCFLNPFIFRDTTSTKYGNVNTWLWDFGDASTLSDVSILQNPSYVYSTPGIRTVSLIVSNSKGCVDTVTKEVEAIGRPTITLPFHDTLICKGDSVRLIPSVSVPSPIFSWTPVNNITNPNIANPFVFPTDTTTYFLQVDEQGCTNQDSIKVNVIPFVSVYAGNDTSICRGDTIMLNPTSNGLHFTWSPPTALNDANIKNPLAFPQTNILYALNANVGKCNTASSITVKVAPYPLSNAGLDTFVCYGNTTQLVASITGSQFSWSPTNSLLNPISLNPIAGPQTTTTYQLIVFDTIGCPKPGKDSITVRVIPPVNAYAGNDTIIVATQPLQLNATGGSNYAWSPPINMNNPAIYNPIVLVSNAPDTITYRVKVSVPEGCFAYDDIKVTVFKTLPEIFIPSAFTPNSDGLNDILKPIIVGLKTFSFFRVFNRWGNMLYSTSEIGQGWDGNFGGAKQASGTFVYEAQGIDYLGNKIVKKGTVVLIR